MKSFVYNYPITLEDILIAIENSGSGGDNALFVYGDTILFGHYEKENKGGYYSHAYWQLGKPLHEQDEQTLQFIKDILK